MRRAAVALLLLGAACGPALAPAGPGVPGGPVPPPRGQRSGLTQSAVIGPAGGSLTLASASGWSLTLTVPAGAVAADTGFSISDLTVDPASEPGYAGVAYRVDPADAALGAAVTLTFSAPAGVDCTTLTPAVQGVLGYWLRVYGGVTRTAPSLSVTTTLLGDWSLVTTASQHDLTGTFTLDSTQGLTFHATGQATLQYLTGNGSLGSYLPQGTITLQTPVTRPDTVTCTTAAPTEDLPVSIADLTPTMLQWGINGDWHLTCADGAAGFVSTNFDSLGITNIGCTRTFTSATGSALDGTYAVSCPDGSGVTAAWTFAPGP